MFTVYTQGTFIGFGRGFSMQQLNSFTKIEEPKFLRATEILSKPVAFVELRLLIKLPSRDLTKVVLHEVGKVR